MVRLLYVTLPLAAAALVGVAVVSPLPGPGPVEPPAASRPVSSLACTGDRGGSRAVAQSPDIDGWALWGRWKRCSRR